VGVFALTSAAVMFGVAPLLIPQIAASGPYMDGAVGLTGFFSVTIAATIRSGLELEFTPASSVASLFFGLLCAPLLIPFAALSIRLSTHMFGALSVSIGGLVELLVWQVFLLGPFALACLFELSKRSGLLGALAFAAIIGLPMAWRAPHFIAVTIAALGSGYLFALLVRRVRG